MGFVAIVTSAHTVAAVSANTTPAAPGSHVAASVALGVVSAAVVPVTSPAPAMASFATARS